MFLFQNVDNVVDSDAPKQLACLVRHGQSDNVVLLEHLGHFLLIDIRCHAHHLGSHDLLNPLVRRKQQELLERHAPHEQSVIVHNIHRIDILVLLRHPPHFSDGLLDRIFLVDDGHLLRHDAAGGGCVVPQQLLDMRGVFNIHRLEDPFGLLIREFADNVGRIVGVHLIDQFRQLRLGKGCQQPFPMRVIQIQEYFASDIVWKQIENKIGFINLEPVDDVRYVGGIEVLKNIQEEEFRPGFDDILNVTNEFIVDFDQLTGLGRFGFVIFFLFCHWSVKRT